MSFSSELEAFRAFIRLYPERCVLLVDTYDTITSGVPNAITAYKEMRAKGVMARPAIRLDSGDLAKLSKIAYRLMTEAGLEDPLIVASNDLEEDLIADLKRQGAKINSWGVGTHLITSHDCPALSGVYKLVALREKGQWQPRIKISSNASKATDPGYKRVTRYYNDWNQPIGDVMGLFDEGLPDSDIIPGRNRTQPHMDVRLRGATRSEDLLEVVFENGVRVGKPPSIHAVRQRALDQVAALPEEFKRLRNPEIYRVILSPEVGRLKEEMLKNPD
jgi:nicotinate phosphoribosyltransferase